MLLNADILFDSLPADMGASIDGPRPNDLTLGRPELLESTSGVFKANHLYLVEAGLIPESIPAERGSVIASIGDSKQLERYRQTCCVITMPTSTEFAKAFNNLQRTFDLYDSWENELNNIVEGTADVTALLSCSERIFDNPIYVIGDNFQVVGTSPLCKTIVNALADNGSLKLESLSKYMDSYDLALREREPLLIKTESHTSLNRNLFEGDQYLGAVTVNYTQRPYKASDEALISFLARAIERAIGKHSARPAHDSGALQLALQYIIEGKPLEGVEREVLESANNGRMFVCARMKPSGENNQIPLGYVRDVVKQILQHSIVFELQRSCVATIVFIDNSNGEDYRTSLSETMDRIAHSLELSIGISNPHDNLYDARYLFEQASEALRIAALFPSSEVTFYFSDSAFHTMLLNAIENTRLDLLCPDGLRRLCKHDRKSSTSYAETLEAYLDNNMSVTKTANALFVHRSTLLERLNRIRRLLDIDLNDPEQRLLVSFLLKAMNFKHALGDEDR